MLVKLKGRIWRWMLVAALAVLGFSACREPVEPDKPSSGEEGEYYLMYGPRPTNYKQLD